MTAAKNQVRVRLNSAGPDRCMPRMVRLRALDGYRTRTGTLEFGERVVLAISGGVAPACGVVRDMTDR